MFWITLPSPAGAATAVVSGYMKTLRFWVFLYISLYSYAAASHQGVAAQLERIDKAIESNPQNQVLLIQRGALYSHDGQYDRAEKDFLRAESLGAPVSVAYELGLLFYRSQAFARARTYFDRYIKQFPQHASAYEYRARTAHRLGDTKQALADFEVFFELQPKASPGHYIDVAKIYAAETFVNKTDVIKTDVNKANVDETNINKANISKTNVNKTNVNKTTGLDAAIDLLDKGMATIGLTPQLQRYAITLELNRNQPDKAIARLQRLEPLLKGSPSWKLEMAQLFLQTGKTAQAQQLLNKASAELAVLKLTPARISLAEKITQLNDELAHRL